MRLRFLGFSSFRARVFWSVVPIVVGFLVFLSILLYFAKKRVWARVGGDPVGLLPEGQQHR